ncbi:MAG: hypothetical protein ACRCZF_07355, partial [Gemmataceae bacterium]
MLHLRQYWKPFLLLLFLPILGNIFAGELRDWIYWQMGWKEGNDLAYLWKTTLISGILFCLLANLAIVYGRSFFRPRNIALGPLKTPQPHAHLVLFLSNLNTSPDEFDRGVPKGLMLTGKLDADLTTMLELKTPTDPTRKPIRWLWEMPLRGLGPHRATLESVILICTRESLSQAHWFARLLNEVYQAEFPHLRVGGVQLLMRQGNTVSLDQCPVTETGCGDDPNRSWDFEDIDVLYDGLIRMISVMETRGVRPKNIM